MLSTLLPPSLPLDVLKNCAGRSYGLEGKWLKLEGERDQNFRVTEETGTDWVFKVCHPDEGAAIMACHAEALEHIARVDPSLMVPRLRRTNDGRTLSPLAHGGRDYLVLLLSYLPGRVIAEHQLGPDQLFEAGSWIARLGVALRGFIHGAPAGRKLVWDVKNAASLAGETAHLPPEHRDIACDIMDRHRGRTVPTLARLRSQIIHGDVHPFNSLMNDAGAMSGIIDFGDLVHGALVLDLSNAIADFLNPAREHETTITNLVRGYCSVTRLEEEEADVLLDLIETRLLMTPLIESLKAAGGIAKQVYYSEFNARCLQMIRELRALDQEQLRNAIRRAAAMPPKRPQQPANLDETIVRRRRAMGDKLYVFYDPPLHMVKGEGVWLTASDARRYLDCYNNVPHVGHCHPYVTEAIVRQARILNTNTRYLTDQSVDYAERLSALSANGLSSVVFVNSGSEANDLAWRMAKAWTGKQGGLAMEFAYHGVSEAIDAFSPSNSPQHWYAPHIRLLPPPDIYRRANGANEPDAGSHFAAMAEPLIGELEAEGFGLAAAIIDSAFMSNGILDAPQGYVKGIVERVHNAGGLFIADEVQSGFGRMGSAFWGHAHHGVVPDFITIGKPAGNGHPVGAVITRPEILGHFLKSGPFFSTFGGNNVACAAGIAVLDVIRDEGLVENARVTGDYLRSGLTALMDKHSIIGDVRGVGQATGVELVRDRRTREPAGSETSRLLGLLRDEGVLIGSDGAFGNVLKIRPPIVFTKAHAVIALGAVDRALRRL